MKEYNRTTKRWEERTEQVGSLKKSDTCRGKRPHDLILVLPPYLYGRQPELIAEDIEKYYDIETRRAKSNQEFDKELESLGMKSRLWNSREPERCYECTVCGKRI